MPRGSQHLAVFGERRRQVGGHERPGLRQFLADQREVGRAMTGGGGTARLWFCRPTNSEYMEDASDVTTMTIGTSITATPTSPISSADQRLPSLDGQTEMQRIQHHRQDRRPEQDAAKRQYDPAAGVD